MFLRTTDIKVEYREGVSGRDITPIKFSRRQIYTVGEKATIVGKYVQIRVNIGVEEKVA